jgi:WD40-like Beta Propeller Repeat
VRGALVLASQRSGVTPEITSALGASLSGQRLRIALGFALAVLVAAGFSACGGAGGSGQAEGGWPTDRGTSWAPDSRRIVFASDRAPGSRRFQIYTVRIDGTGLRRLTAFAAQSEDPAWAPSGRWIAYDVEAGGQPRIYLIRPGGTGRRRLTRVNDTNPLWSPNGSKIAFTRSSSSPLAIRRPLRHGRKRR